MPGEEYLTEPEIWYLVQSIVKACAYQESRQVFHGDLRPQNILLTDDGHVKLIDHGVIHYLKNGY
jgi:serine/threonine protein kinase